MKIALLGDIAFFGKHSITIDKKAVLEYFKEAAEFLSKFRFLELYKFIHKRLI